MNNWYNKLYIFTIFLFALGFLNIIFALIGFICIITPFILLYKDNKKTWCQSYCPRLSFFTTVSNGKSITDKTVPKWFTKFNIKSFWLVYFSFNLFILFMSTLMVSLGRMEVMDNVRFLIAFQLPWDIPQFINIDSLPSWIIHLSFRVYSMMFTTTIIGLILTIFYKPKTWCMVCPVNTISDNIIKNKKN